jgi:hypothetical protein
MAKSNQVVPKKGRGRPATGRDPVTAIRLSEDFRVAVDKWAAKQDDKPARSEAIRRLVELGLKAPTTKTPKKRDPDQTIKDSDGRVIPPPAKTRVLNK